MLLKKYIIVALLVVTGLVNFSCEKGENGQGHVGQDQPQGQILDQAEGDKNLTLNKLLSSQNSDYAYVAKFLPKYFDRIKTFVKDEPTTLAKLKPLFDKAINFAQEMSKKPKPYSDEDKSIHDKNINELKTEVEKAISNLSAYIRGNLDKNNDIEIIAKQQLSIEREEARSLLAEFSIDEENFSLSNIFSPLGPFELEALSFYLDTKFRQGLDSELVKNLINVKAELDALKKAIDDINQAHQKGLSEPDLKIYQKARDSLVSKIAAGLNRKINQGQKDDLLRDYLGSYVYDSIKAKFKKLGEKIQSTRDKVKALSEGHVTLKLLKEAVEAADIAKNTALTSDIGDTNYVVKDAHKAVKDAYVVAARIAKEEAKKFQAEAEKARDKKDLTPAADAATMAKNYFEAVKLLKQAEPATAADVDAAENAYNLAQKAHVATLATQPLKVLEDAAQKAVQALVSPLNGLKDKLQKFTADVSSIKNVVAESDKIADLIDMAKLNISNVGNKDGDVAAFNVAIGKAEQEVKDAYIRVANAAKDIADKQHEKVKVEYQIIRDIRTSYDNLLQEGRLIINTELKQARVDEKRAENALAKIKTALKVAKDIASTVDNKLGKTLAADAKKIGDKAVGSAQEVQRHDGWAVYDVQVINDTLRDIILRADKSSSILKYKFSEDFNSAHSKYNVAVIAITDIKVIEDRNIDPEKKAADFLIVLKKVIDAIYGFDGMRHHIDGAAKKINSLRTALYNPIPDTDDLLPKAEAEGKLEELDKKIEAFEKRIVGKVLPEVKAFGELVKKAKQDVESEKAIAGDISKGDDERKAAIEKVKNYDEQAAEFALAAWSIYSEIAELQRVDKTAVEDAAKEAERHSEEIYEAYNQVKDLVK